MRRFGPTSRSSKRWEKLENGEDIYRVKHSILQGADSSDTDGYGVDSSEWGLLRLDSRGGRPHSIFESGGGPTQTISKLREASGEKGEAMPILPGCPPAGLPPRLPRLSFAVVSIAVTVVLFAGSLDF